MSDATIRPLDIVDVKAGIRAGRLFVQIRDNHLLLGDFQTGEAVSLSDIEVKAVMHARWIDESKEFEGFVIHSCRCSACGKKPLYRRDVDYTQTHTEVNFRYDQSNFCPNCGARMDGEADAETNDT